MPILSIKMKCLLSQTESAHKGAKESADRIDRGHG
jgi:hypothetical protein